MKKGILSFFVFILTLSAVQSEEIVDQKPLVDRSFLYAGLGVALPFYSPGFLLGYRNKHSGFALDYHGGFFYQDRVPGVKMKVTGVSGGVSYLKYIKDSHFYIGAGPEFGARWVEFYPVYTEVSPTACFGYEDERVFHQITVAPVTYTQLGKTNETKVAYKLGIKF